MRCKFDNSQPCGMKEYLGVCACDMCKENPTKIRELKKGKQTVRAVHEREQELDVDLKNVDLTEFYNFDADVEAVIKKNLDSLEKQQEKKAKQQLKKEEREIKRKEERKSKELHLNVAEGYKEHIRVSVEEQSQINAKNKNKKERVKQVQQFNNSLKNANIIEAVDVKEKQLLVAGRITIEKKPGILSRIKKWLFR